MLSRRQFVSITAAAAALAATRPSFATEPKLGHKERVDRALKGRHVDRPPFTLWHHFNKATAEEEAQALVDFHRQYDTDIVKVMNDFSYPKSTTGKWYEVTPTDSPYPKQLETLELVRDGLKGDAYFIDTLYGPYMTAQLLLTAEPQFRDQKLSDDLLLNQLGSALQAFQKSNPQAWHDMLGAITESTVSHIKKAAKIGTSGALVSIMNGTTKLNSVEDYEQYSRPYDKRVMDALADTRLTMLHLHFLDEPFITQFRDFNAPVINYSVKTSGIPMSTMRKSYTQALAGGVDEVNYDSLTVEEIRQEWTTARQQAGTKYIITPGCSVPNTSTPAALARLRESVNA
jgi:hypothetical protein